MGIMKTLCILPLLFLVTLAGAQTKPAVKPTVKPIAKGPVPKIQASLGGKDGGAIDLTVARVMIDFPLLLKDEKGAVYPVKQCTFVYKRIRSFDDEVSGEKKFGWEYLVKDLRNNEQLDEFWRTEVRESLQKGEEIHFQKILADSKKGYLIPVKGISFKINK
jgi:hypothetical protein